MVPNPLKQKLKNGELVLGPFINCADAAFLEIYGHGGFYFAAIELEGGPTNLFNAEDLCRAADCAGLQKPGFFDNINAILPNC